MLSDERRQYISDILRPIAPPRELTDVYTEDQLRRLLDVVHQGAWPLILAQHFSSPEALMATMSGAAPFGLELKLDMFMTPTFRGFYANYSAALFPEIQDCFYNPTFLEYAKSYWGAQYAKPQMMLFNVNGPCANCDPGHLDAPSFRGVRYESAPTWLVSVMGKSGLFRDYLIKMAQVITWFSHDPTSGFTYWPDGPVKQPQRLQPPIYNRGVVVQNEMMLHRGEANGPLDQQYLPGLAFDSKFNGDPADKNGWQVKTGDKVIAQYKTDDLRFLVHWSAEVFEDFSELKKNMDHTADLSLDQVFETLIKDVRSMGIEISPPADPLTDPVFIKTLNDAYDFGGAEAYPMEAFPSPLRLDGAQAA